MFFEMAKLGTADLEFPDFTGRMQKIQMGMKARRRNPARHFEAAHQQGPIEAFSVKGYEHRPFAYPSRQFEQHRIFFTGIAHEELFDLNPAGIPPCQADKKR